MKRQILAIAAVLSVGVVSSTFAQPVGYSGGGGSGAGAFARVGGSFGGLSTISGSFQVANIMPGAGFTMSGANGGMTVGSSSGADAAPHRTIGLASEMWSIGAKANAGPAK